MNPHKKYILAALFMLVFIIGVAIGSLFTQIHYQAYPVDTWQGTVDTINVAEREMMK
jgi:hypothetical protein